MSKWSVALAALMAVPAAAQTPVAPVVPVAPLAPVAGPPAAAPSLDAMRTIDLKAQLRQLGNWLPGTYDNHEQVIRQSGHALMPKVERPFRRVHIVTAALPAAAFGPNAWRWTEHHGNDAATLGRDEVLVAATDLAANALRIKRYRVTSDATPATPAGAAYLGEACDLLLRYEGAQLTGQLASTQCAAPGGLADYRVIIGPRFVWVKAGLRDKAGRLVQDMAPGSGFDWHQATRARTFSCDVFGDPNGDMANTKFVRKISLHDQGGVAEIPWPDGRTLEFTIHTRAFSIAPTREHPLFRVHEKGNPVPIAYAYAEDDSDDFGLNLGWFYIRCAAQ